MPATDLSEAFFFFFLVDGTNTLLILKKVGLGLDWANLALMSFFLLSALESTRELLSRVWIFSGPFPIRSRWRCESVRSFLFQRFSSLVLSWRPSSVLLLLLLLLLLRLSLFTIFVTFTSNLSDEYTTSVYATNCDRGLSRISLATGGPLSIVRHIWRSDSTVIIHCDHCGHCYLQLFLFRSLLFTTINITT